ncbi:hypothetical protein [Aeromicrobium sp.]|uniref:hypothetical protein n=1 Tax=Aeromicrobium sp. TaxID=1871063 RepID=UPI003C3F3AB2
MSPTSTRSPSRCTLELELLSAEARSEELANQVALLQNRVHGLQAASGSWRPKAGGRSPVQKVRAAAVTAIVQTTNLARRWSGNRAEGRKRLVIADHPRAEPLALRDAPPLPEPSWTVARLRVAAREQGVVGFGRMRKEQLLMELI